MTIQRYQSENISTSSLGAQVYSTALTTDIAVDINDKIITVGKHERLDNLAFQYYGDSSLWWVIAQANNIVNGSLYVREGSQIIIPNSNKVL